MLILLKQLRTNHISGASTSAPNSTGNSRMRPQAERSLNTHRRPATAQPSSRSSEAEGVFTRKLMGKKYHQPFCEYLSNRYAGWPVDECSAILYKPMK